MYCSHNFIISVLMQMQPYRINLTVLLVNKPIKLEYKDQGNCLGIHIFCLLELILINSKTL